MKIPELTPGKQPISICLLWPNDCQGSEEFNLCARPLIGANIIVTPWEQKVPVRIRFVWYATTFQYYYLYNKILNVK